MRKVEFNNPDFQNITRKFYLHVHTEVSKDTPGLENTSHIVLPVCFVQQENGTLVIYHSES